MLLVSLSTLGISQKSNLVFFAENGEKFTIVMNGLRYNEAPATNVKLTDLMPTTYKVKAIFQDPALGEVTKTIQLQPYVEYTFNIRTKKTTVVGSVLKGAGNQVARDLNMKDSTNTKDDGKEQYVMRYVSEVPLQAPASAYPPAPQPVYNTQPVVVQQPGTVTQTTTTTTRVNGQQVQTAAPGGSVNMSVNDPDLGVNFNMNVGIPADAVITSGGTVQQTTTTTYGGNPTYQQQQTTQQYVMPGYNGPIGCPWPMDQSSFSAASQTVSGQSFEDNKLQIAKQAFNSNCMTSAQVAQLMALFSFEDSKLDFAKFAYGHTYDLGNYYLVNNAFTFSSSVDNLNAFIARGGR